MLKDPISFTGELERADVDFLEKIAEKRDVSVASLVRNAVAAYVQRQKRR
jgi:predicted transcriptional regulator